ncbi:MAG: hypothetical protein ACK4HV_01945 [Parachlamydiaceae bacterium]
MTATLLSFILAVALFFLPRSGGNENEIATVLRLFFVISAINLITVPLLHAFSWLPLQKGEQNSTPHLMELFSQDKGIRLKTSWLLLFPLLTLGLIIIDAFQEGFDKFSLILIWILLLGFTLDIYSLLIARIRKYLDPFKSVQIFTQEAKEAIKKDDVNKIIESIDSLFEIARRAYDRSNTSLASQAIYELKEIGVHFLSASKSLPNLNQELSDFETKKIDTVGYTFSYLVSRLSLLAEKAIEKRYDPLVNQIISSLGRLTISSAKFDMTMTGGPLQAISSITAQAVKANMRDVGLKTPYLLVEVARSISKEADFSYQEIKTPFNALLSAIDTADKELFKLDKNISIDTFKQPFIALINLFSEPVFTNHQDGAALKAIASQYLDEYKTLESVLVSIPPIPQV